MALASTTVWECRVTGNDGNGGGFNPARGGTDYTLQDSPQATGTATVSGTTLTATTGIFTSAMVGNLVTDGTSWREITAFTSSTVVTIDSTVSWTAASIKVGGALASQGMAAGLKSLGQPVFIKYSATPFTITTATANVSGGVVAITYDGSDSVADLWVGYDTTRTALNTDANRPTIKVASSGVTSCTLFAYAPGSTVANVLVRNVVWDGNAKTGIECVKTNANASAFRFDNCSANNATNGGFNFAAGRAFALGCSATGCSTVSPFSCNGDTVFLGCKADANTVSGFHYGASGRATAINCIASNNTGTSDGFTLAGGEVGMTAVNCTAYGNGRDGFHNGSGNARGVWFVNCLAVNNSGYGYNNAGGSPVHNYLCAGGFPNTLGNENAITYSYGFVTLSGDPFTNAAGGDFSLNSTAGAGAACRGAGYQPS